MHSQEFLCRNVSTCVHSCPHLVLEYVCAYLDCCGKQNSGLIREVVSFWEVGLNGYVTLRHDGVVLNERDVVLHVCMHYCACCVLQ